MKQLIIFIALKAVEITGIVFVLWWIGHIPWVKRNFVENDKTRMRDFWLAGFAVLGLVILAIMVLSLSISAILCFVSSNWQWAGELAGKL
jgi:multisubunit Na+/H+ antiporter MnhB subunit